jgi:hypothetical protein
VLIANGNLIATRRVGRRMTDRLPAAPPIAAAVDLHLAPEASGQGGDEVLEGGVEVELDAESVGGLQ